MSELLVHVKRGGYVESRHLGDLAVVDRDGKILYSVGDPHRFTFWRSAAKPFQTIPLVEEGGIEHFQICDEELALMTSSHGGEDKHVKVVRSILSKIFCNEVDLDCGTSSPMYGKAAAQILRSGGSFESVNNPCSGKHSAMLALSVLLEMPFENYIDLHHPIQQKMLETIAQCCDMKAEDVVVAVDGCGVPVFGMGIDKMATAYGKLTKPEGIFPIKRTQALRKILSAMTNNPFYVAGTNRLDTILMEVTKGKILAKLGAEGVYNVGIVNEGIGICIKIDDGNYRAIDPVIIQLLMDLNFLTSDEFQALKHLWKPQLKNHRKEVIGELEPAFKLKKHC